MIANERQYKISKKELEKFESAYAAALASAPDPGVHRRLHQAMQEGLASQIDDLRSQIKRYEALRAGDVRGTVLTSIVALLPALIEARIAAGLTQLALSQLLGVAEQQVQRWEATGYAGVSVEKVQAIADAVGLSVREEVSYTVSA
ncbi:helix-turn-helix transcriptional regulator [Nakamurella multipartita]|uniref:Helix-turn-helix domain protein n=1 Tax=Nakamurella multipartita (strain ATCC 700099 / DSM 44233 / CIP 104796 / JCM 9543 / NBRC 105858 / Y-104) TaxID=479431 RepID=C8XKU4_NAKMY|nr:helix-turn-helix transcriptional regulator [Nakamurella multipartita]ACV80751.1 helix-turn-helix domain protein [Nakamurella multipartita DSM 44233]